MARAKLDDSIGSNSPWEKKKRTAKTGDWAALRQAEKLLHAGGLLAPRAGLEMKKCGRVETRKRTWLSPGGGLRLWRRSREKPQQWSGLFFTSSPREEPGRPRKLPGFLKGSGPRERVGQVGICRSRGTWDRDQARWLCNRTGP